MDANAKPEKDPFLPPMGKLGDVACPRAPQTIEDAGLDAGTLVDLAVKFGYTINRFNADWLVERMCVSPTLASAIVQQVLMEGLIEETMLSTGGKATYRVTERGRRHAERGSGRCPRRGPGPLPSAAHGDDDGSQGARSSGTGASRSSARSQPNSGRPPPSSVSPAYGSPNRTPCLL